MQPFGQACTAMYPKGKAPSKKLGKQAMKGIMVGYDDVEGTKAYRIYVPDLKKIVITPDVTFMDFKASTGKVPDVTTLTDQLYNDKQEKQKMDESEQVQTKTNDLPPKINNNTPAQVLTTLTQTPNAVDKPETENKQPETGIEEVTDTNVEHVHTSEMFETKEEELPTIDNENTDEDSDITTITNVPQVIRRSSRLATKPKQRYDNPNAWWKNDSSMIELSQCHSEFEVYTANLHGNTSYTSAYTPTDHDDAMKCDDKHLWKESMQRENESIKENDVYTKVKIKDIPKGSNIISAKWVFKVKPTSTGEISVYKSRIVA